MMYGNLFYAGIWGMVILFCSTAAITQKPSGKYQAICDTSSLLDDAAFSKGLVLEGTNTSTVRRDVFIFPYGRHARQVQWGLAEWGSRYPLRAFKKNTTGKKAVYAARGKKIIFEKCAGSRHITMEVAASEEYNAPRREGVEWPHLLLGQTFSGKPFLKDLEGLVLKFSGRLTKAVLRMPQNEFDRGLHTAQFQLFITVENLNPASPGHGDFFWFGIPFYDYRYKTIQRFAAQDLGKSDASGKFIYSMGSMDFMNGSFHSGQWITVEKDILPMMKNAVELAKQRGYLNGSAFEDLGLSSMNLGWEVPGTLDVGFEFKGFDVLKRVRR
ncbi:hypothetical protein LL912_21125 [Niabella sp. CC-SYL272]|uniref:hypothetical protein n=1 Tax=Niabella agricola TaxID=2891571 RepID=UPI001F19ED54|nr:hypothetical protein [Niabella agricola]MCF3111303.1 hypothetical protein [Niabella agricola]